MAGTGKASRRMFLRRGCGLQAPFENTLVLLHLEAVHVQGANKVEPKSPTKTKTPKPEKNKTVLPTLWFDLCPFRILL